MKVIGVPDHFRSWELADAGEAAQTSFQRSLALLREGGALAPPKTVAITYWGS
jgi:hypothetical protein